ncbi:MULTISPECIES: vitamin K epoxide reductase family protein [unclassified Prochlorococcus]|uniref:vitamin K epoxide reductase family protein n=1 Tax=unclassified Prochlorococcus TaxID=2627481 RepID=UPI000533AA97|nr:MULTISPECIES: vitamin K epoxide reductase family protein [unclassified Prochlorococcus]KGG16837.1 thioredoxin domain 2 [Prochlorococcus sp. MIT 0602]KGG18189.1 thioredoxin domain 2 [Prochlorococcus sp. MIT 0603]
MGTSRIKSRRRQDPGSKIARTLIGVLATIGIIDTGSITLHRWGWISTLSCPGGTGGCDKVLNSPWGTVFQINGSDIPLSFIGFICYLSVLLLATIPFLPWISTSKLEVTRKAWWGLFLISNSMAIFSFILMGIMIIKIKAFCFFCILSAVISSFIFILTIIGGGWEDRRELFFRGLIVTIVILLGGLIWTSSVDPSKAQSPILNQGEAPIINNKSSKSSIQLAQYLNKKNIILYKAYWCSHCHDQMEMFGNEASDNLKSVECAIDGVNSKTDLCKRKGIEAFPSWEINGEIQSGVKSLDELANISGYNGPRDF